MFAITSPEKLRCQWDPRFSMTIELPKTCPTFSLIGKRVFLPGKFRFASCLASPAQLAPSTKRTKTPTLTSMVPEAAIIQQHKKALYEQKFST